MAAGSALAAWLLASVGAAHAQGLPPLVAGERLGSGWTFVGLPQQSLPVTQFTAVQVDGRAALQLAANGSYGNRVLALAGTPAPARLRWSWRLQQPNPALDLSSKGGDDVPAKVCLSFDLPLSRIGFVERQKLRIAREISGEALPAATLCWVWAGRERVGAVIDNAYSRRLRYLVLRNQNDPLSRWFEEDRDIAADFRSAFGDEAADTVPPLVLVGVGADSDNTGGRSVSQIADLRFAP